MWPGMQCLPNAATEEPFLPSSEDVATCGVALGQLAPTLLQELRDSKHVFPRVSNWEAIGDASKSEFIWACQVAINCCFLGQFQLLGLSAKQHYLNRLLHAARAAHHSLHG